MKLFYIYHNAGYGGGVIMAAARDAEEAEEVFAKYCSVNTRGDFSEVCELVIPDTPGIVLDQWSVE